MIYDFIKVLIALLLVSVSFLNIESSLEIENAQQEIRPLQGSNLDKLILGKRELSYQTEIVPLYKTANSTQDSGPLFSGVDAEITPEIESLAVGLDRDPIRIYEFVKNQIEYMPVWGSLKGSNWTLFERVGTSMDQSSLLIALLRSVDIPAKYVRGTISLSSDEVSNWIGVFNEIEYISSILNGFGIAHEQRTGEAGEQLFDIEHIWVEALIDGQWYAMDPSFKQYVESETQDLAALTGYDQNAFLAALLEGSTTTSDFVQRINTVNMGEVLTEMSSRFIENTSSSDSLSDILGEREILFQTIETLDTDLPYPNSVFEEFDELSDSSRFLFRVEHLGIDVTLRLSEIAGKRLTLFYDEGVPILRLNGDVVMSGTRGELGDVNPINVSLITPIQDVTFTDEQFILVGESIAILIAVGSVPSQIISVPASLDNISSTDDENTLGEILYRMGMTHFHQYLKAEKNFNAPMLGLRLFPVMIMGYARQDEGYTIDIRIDPKAVYSKVNNDSKERARSWRHILSSLEHGHIEQLQGFPAISTIKAFSLANEAGQKIFNVNSENIDNTFPELQYATSFLNPLREQVESGGFLYIPETYVFLGDWAGVGWNDETGAYWINGGIGSSFDEDQGGSSSQAGPIDFSTSTTTIDFNNRLSFKTDNIITDSFFPSDPVDSVSGTFLFENRDFESSQNPDSLFFRSYSSSRGMNHSTLGTGWTHSFNMKLRQHSDWRRGMGGRSVQEAAGLIVAMSAMQDLLIIPIEEEIPFDRVILTSLISQWAVDQLIDNAITIDDRDGSPLIFISHPGGGYLSPNGLDADLTQNSDGSFLLDIENEQWQFSQQGDLVQITNSMGVYDVEYDARSRLSSVLKDSEAYLAFSYDSRDRIIAVSADSAEGVHYEYDERENLTSADAPGGIRFVYSYDSSQRLQTLSRSLDGSPTQELIVNEYDSLGRVVSQTKGGREDLRLFYGDFTSRAEDPLSALTTEYIRDFEENLLAIVGTPLPIITPLVRGETISLNQIGISSLLTATTVRVEILSSSSGIRARLPQSIVQIGEGQERTIPIEISASDLALTTLTEELRLLLEISNPIGPVVRREVTIPIRILDEDDLGIQARSLERGQSNIFTFNSLALASRSSKGISIEPGLNPAAPYGSCSSHTGGFSYSTRENRQSPQYSGIKRNQCGSDLVVFLHSGEFYVHSIDLEIPGRGINWQFVRSYRSGSSFEGSMGHNWEFNYNRRLILVDQNNLRSTQQIVSEARIGDVLRFDGYTRPDLYRWNFLNAAFDSPTGFYTELTRNNDGSFVERDYQGNQIFYSIPDSSGLSQMTRMSDRNNNSLQFHHNELGQLERVIDTLGRPIEYFYDQVGRLIEVTDFADRSLQFGYDFNGDLVTATSPKVTETPQGNDFPDGKTVRYSYSSGFEDGRLNHNLTGVVAPNQVASTGAPRVKIIYQTELNSPDFDRVLEMQLGDVEQQTSSDRGNTISSDSRSHDTEIRALNVPLSDRIFGSYTYSYQSLNDGFSRDLVSPISKTTVVDRNGNIKEYLFNQAGNILETIDFSKPRY